MADERKRFTKENVYLRRSKIAELRIEGMTYEAITNELIDSFGADNLPSNYDAGNCYDDMQAYLNSVKIKSTETINEIVTVETLRLDVYLQRLKDNINAGDVRSIETALKISERRSKLLGLDSAIKIDWKIEIGMAVSKGLITLNDVRKELSEDMYFEFLESNPGLIEGGLAEVIKDLE